MSALAYSTELLTAYYSSNHYKRFAFINRIKGPFAGFYWMMVFCNVIVPQTLWFERMIAISEVKHGRGPRPAAVLAEPRHSLAEVQALRPATWRIS